MADSQQVVSGQYLNYLKGPNDRYRWGCSQTVAGVAAQFLGIWLNVMLPRAVKLFLRIQNLASRHIRQTAATWPGHTPEEVNVNTTIERAGWGILLNAFHSTRPGAHELHGAGSPIRRRTTPSEYATGFLFTAIYLAFIAFGVIASWLAGDDTSLAASKDCDIYLPDSKGSFDRLNSITTPYEFDAQTQSAEYARRCYGKGDSSDGCDLFVKKDISYSSTHNYSCPFQEDSMCYGGANSSYTMSTGAVSAHALSINTKRKYEFMRTTTCTPLNMNGSFITSEQEGNETVFSYHYSRRILHDLPSDVTWQTHTYGDFVGKGPMYMVGVFSTYGGFVPSPQLDVGPTKLLTLIFILPQKIFYTKQSEDPIFPSTGVGAILPPGNTTKYWMYEGGHARPLACVDTLRWRDRQQGPEWRLYRDLIFLDAAGRLRGDLRLFAHSLLNSQIYQTISKRLAAGLNATSRISLSTSLPLAKEQWKVEATQLFEASLARASFETRNIALGTYANYPGYVRQNTDHSMCDRTYIYQKPGWSSINGLWYLILLIPSTLVIFLAFPIKEVDSEQILLFEWLCGDYKEKMSYYSALCAVKMFGALKFASEKLLRIIEKGSCVLWSRSCASVRAAMSVGSGFRRRA